MPFARIALFLAIVAQPLFANSCVVNWAYINNPSRRVGVEPAAVQKLSVDPTVDVTQALGERLKDDSLKLMTLNTENLELFWTMERARQVDGRRVTPIHQKPLEKVLAQAEHILQQNPDVITLQEIADSESLQRFAAQFLGGRYRPVIFPTNDPRGIHVAMLVRRDLPLEFVAESHIREPKESGDGRVHSRDAVTLLAKIPGTDRALFAIIGTHAKSKRRYKDRPNEGDGTTLRTEQAKAMAVQYADLKKKYPALPVFIMADFNNDFNRAPEYQALRDLGMRDPIDVVNDRLPEDQRIAEGDLRRVTETTFHPEDRSGHRLDFPDAVRRTRAGDKNVIWVRDAGQLDGALTDADGQKLVVAAGVQHWTDRQGRELELPPDHAAREEQPSDHLPYVVTLSFGAAVKEAGLDPARFVPAPSAVGFQVYPLAPVFNADRVTHPFGVADLAMDGIRQDQPNPLPRLETGDATVGLKNFGRWTEQAQSAIADRKVLAADHLIIVPRDGEPRELVPDYGFTFANLRVDGNGFAVELRPLSGPAALRVLRFDAAGNPIP